MEEQKLSFNNYPILAVTMNGEPISKLNYKERTGKDKDGQPTYTDHLIWQPTSEEYFDFADIDDESCSLYGVSSDLPELVIIPALVNGRRVVAIEDSCFYNRSGMKYLYIPHTVKTIGFDAFRECPDLEEVIIPKNSELCELGDSVFRNSDSLRKITLENAANLYTIPARAFRNCSALYSVKLPPNLETIEQGAFSWSNIGHITFPKTLQTISDFAFFACTGFFPTLIPKSVTNVGFWAFGATMTADHQCEAEERPDGWSGSWCGLLGRLGASWNVTGDSPFAFRYISGGNNSDIIDPNDPYEDQCEVLAGDLDFVIGQLTIPEEVPGEYYYGLYAGESVVAIADSGFINCTEITEINTGNTVKRIGKQAFAGCTKLGTLTLGESVKSIGDYAFEGCASLTTITIPDGVVSIGDCAFKDCSALSEVYIPDSVTFIGQDAFLRCKSNLVVYCDKLSVDNPFVPHKHSWSDWKTVIESTCNEQGKLQRTCSSCGRKDTEYIAKLPHSLDDGVIVDSATCTTSETRKYTCTVCGETVTKISSEPLGHSFDEGTVTSNATCTTTGVRKYTCTICNHTKTETIDRIAHSCESTYYPPTAAEGGKYVYTCTDCEYSYPEYIPGEPAFGYNITIINNSHSPRFIINGSTANIHVGEARQFTIYRDPTSTSGPSWWIQPGVEVTGASWGISGMEGTDTNSNPADDKLYITIYNPTGTGYSDTVTITIH